MERVGVQHPGRMFALSSPMTERELKWVIGKTDFFIGSRMHACIAALSQCVPAVGLAYSDKFLGVFDSAGVGESIIDLRQFTTIDVTEKALAAFANRAEIARHLKARIPALQENVTDTFRGILSGLARAPQ